MSKPDFIKKQYEFSAHIRDPQKNPTPADIEDRRMGIYRDLFYKNIEGFISGGFPVLRKFYNDSEWEELIRNFIAHHKSASPYFLEISEEFITFLQQEHQPRSCDPAFMLELAHYEWAELALLVLDEDIDMQGIQANGDMLSGHPVQSPLAWVLSYQWPVHQLSPDFKPQEPPEHATHIIVFRDRKDKVRFVVINPITARLLQLLRENSDLSGQAALKIISQEMNHPNPQVVEDGGKQALEQLKSQGIILGVR